MKRLLLILALCVSGAAQNPRHVILSHPRMIINDTIMDTWETSTTRLTAIAARVLGGNATATANFNTMVGELGGTTAPVDPDLSQSPQQTIASTLAYAGTYAFYHKNGNDTVANRFAAALWNSMVVTSGGPAYTVTNAVFNGTDGTLTLSSIPSPAILVGDQTALWGLAGDFGCGGFCTVTFSVGTTIKVAAATAVASFNSGPMILATNNSGGFNAFWGTGPTGEIPAYVTSWAYFYDWCYDWLVANSHDQYVRNQLKTGYWSSTLTRQSSQFADNVREADYHNYTSWSLEAVISAGLALYGDDSLGTTILDEGAGYFWEGISGIQPANCCLQTYTYNVKASVDVLTSGAWNWESPGYIRNGPINLIRAVEAYDSATARFSNLWVNQFSTSKNMGMYEVYSVQPNGLKANLGDTGNSTPWSSGKDNTILAIIDDRFPDPHFTYMMTTWTAPTYTTPDYWNMGGLGDTGLIYKNIFFPYVNGPGSHDFTDLPLSAQFGQDVFMRTGWGVSDDYITFTSSMRGTYHRHEDGGTYTVYKINPLILAQPYTLVAPIYYQYNRRTIGANSLTIYDALDCWKGDAPPCGLDSFGDPIVNDGGQLYSNRRFDPQFPVNRFSILRTWSGTVYSDPTYSAVYTENNPIFQPIYAAGSHYEHVRDDLSKFYTSAYNGLGDNPNIKTSSVQREVVHFQPSLGTLPPLVTFDRMTATNASYKKSWLMHTVNTPTVDATTPTPGDHTYSGASKTMADNGTGRVYVSHLLPVTPTVRAVGGNGCPQLLLQSATNANPAVFLVTAHGLTAGEAIAINTGTADYGSPWYSGWFLDTAFTYANIVTVGTVVDADHITINVGGVPYDSASQPTWVSTFTSGNGSPITPGVHLGSVYYQLDAAGGNTVWQWDNTTWQHLVTYLAGYPAGLNLAGPTIYSQAACNWAYYVDQLGPAGSPGAHLWNSVADISPAEFRPNWLVSTSPPTSNLTDYFLNVVTPTTTSVGTAPTTTLVSSAGWYGAQIADSGGSYVAMFPTSTSLQSGASYSVTHTGTAQHVVTGLLSGTVTVRQGASVIATAAVDSSGSVGFTETGGGAFTLSLGAPAAFSVGIQGKTGIFGRVVIR